MATRASARDFPLAPLKPAAWWTLVAITIFTTAIAAWASCDAQASFPKVGLPASIALVRAFCLITPWDRVLVLPVHDDRLLLLSPKRPRELLDALQALAPAQARS